MRLQLADALGRLRLLTAHTHGIVFELDQNARFVRVWASDPRLLARPQEQLLGLTVVEALGPELGQQHHDAAVRTVQRGVGSSYEYWLEVPSGRRHFACESVPVPAPSGKGRHVVFWIRDTTDQVVMQRNLLETERLASLGTLAAGVAHEINNPLAYMLLNVEQLRRALTEESRNGQLSGSVAPLIAWADMIHEGTRRVQRIVQDLIQLSRPDVPLEAISVEPALHEALDLIQGESASSHPGAEPLRNKWEVTLHCDPTPPVFAHHGRLVQVLVNLLDNAFAAVASAGDGSTTQEPAIRLEARQEGDFVVICVADRGCGLDPETAHEIFTPFFTTKQEGTGLGLAICRRLVSSFQGEISAAPNEPRGTVVRVSLPISPSK